MRNPRNSPSQLAQRKRYTEITRVRKEFEQLFWQFDDSSDKPGTKDYLCEIVFQLMDIRRLLEKNQERIKNDKEEK